MSRTRTPAPSDKAEASASQDKPAKRVIKKYPNRRLYDTEGSTYVTLAQVRDLVMRHEPFVVRDAKTGEDLTRSILLQIILEAEAGGAPMFSEAMLANIIRFYGHTMQGFMGSYLDKNIQSFMEIQSKLAEQSQGLSPELWTQFLHMQSSMMQGLMSSYLEQSKNMFLQMQEQMARQTQHVLGAFGVKH